MFIFSSVSIILASIGIILAATSFISGVQLVRNTSRSIEGWIHRANGYGTIILFVLLALIAVPGIRDDPSPFFWPLFGLSIFMLKLWIVRRKKRFSKYVSWLGGTLLLVWLYIFYINIPF